MTYVLRATLVATALAYGAGAALAQQAGEAAPPQVQSRQATAAQAPPPQGGQTPGSPAPAAPPASGATAQTTPATGGIPMPAACPAPQPPATAPSRAFTAPTGLLLHQVQSTRDADFRRLIAYVRDAMAKTTNATLRRQANGWRIFRVAEPGPNGDVLYAFLLDPAVPCADYALGPLLADVYRDPAQLSEIWKLYTGSVRNGGTIMNLVPLPVEPPPPIVTPPTTTPPAPGTPALGTSTPGASTAPAGPTPTVPGQAPPVPLDANPVRRP